MNNPVVSAILLLAILSFPGTASAWKLRLTPVEDAFAQDLSKQNQSQIPFLDGASPIHQQLTLAVFDCTPLVDCKTGLEHEDIHMADVQTGVRWNDFPTVWLTDNSTKGCLGKVSPLDRDKSRCYLMHLVRASLKNAEKDKGKNSKMSWGGRGHFGDLQFLHAMSPRNVSAGKNYENLLIWARFAYEISLGNTYDTNDWVTVVPGMSTFFRPGTRRIGDLMDYQFGVASRGIALGQLLHIAQDSYAACHTLRGPDGRIRKFYHYDGQDPVFHAKHDDDKDALKKVLASPRNPVTFGKALFAARAQRLEWEQVLPIFDAYLKPTDDTVVSERGTGCHQPNPAPEA
ncbi:hypothetical protein [Achromobacter aegrifaciens]